MGKWNSDDMDYLSEIEVPDCSIHTIDPMFSPVLNTVHTDNHDLTKKLIRWVYPDGVIIYMYCLTEMCIMMSLVSE